VSTGKVLTHKRHRPKGSVEDEDAKEDDLGPALVKAPRMSMDAEDRPESLDDLTNKLRRLLGEDSLLVSALVSLNQDADLVQLRGELSRDLCIELMPFLTDSYVHQGLVTPTGLDRSTLRSDPLRLATTLGLLALLRLLLECHHLGLGPNHVLTAEGITILMVAAVEGHVDMAKFLLGAKADPQAVTSDAVVVYTGARPCHSLPIGAGATPLHFAALSGSLSLVLHILSAIPARSRVAAANWATSSGTTALHTAADMGLLSMAELLMEEGANVNIADSRGRTPLTLAASSGCVPLVWALADKGACVHAVTAAHSTALLDAVENEDEQMAAALIEKKVDVNQAMPVTGNTALLEAARTGQSHLVARLLSAGAIPYTESVHGDNAAGAAIENQEPGRIAVLDVLTRAGVDLFRPNQERDTSLTIAYRNADAPVLHFMLRDGPADAKESAWTLLLASSPMERYPSLAAQTVCLVHVLPLLAGSLVLGGDRSAKERAMANRARLLAASIRAYVDMEQASVLEEWHLPERGLRTIVLQYARRSMWDLLETQHLIVFGEPYPHKELVALSNMSCLQYP